MLTARGRLAALAAAAVAVVVLAYAAGRATAPDSPSGAAATIDRPPSSVRVPALGEAAAVPALRDDADVATSAPSGGGSSIAVPSTSAPAAGTPSTSAPSGGDTGGGGSAPPVVVGGGTE